MNRCWIVALVLGTVLLAGCAGQFAFREAQDLTEQKRYDAAVEKFGEAVDLNPGNQEYRLALFAARSRAAIWHLERAQTLLAEEKFRQAAAEFTLASEFDPSLGAAQMGKAEAEKLLRGRELVTEAENFLRGRRLNQAKQNLDRALLLDPGNPQALALLEQLRQKRKPFLDGFELDVASEEPITLTFKEADVRDVFNILSKLSGINFIFDEEIRSETVSLKLEQASFAQALELLLKLNNLDKKVLNPRTIIIYPKTKEKEKQYDDLLIQTFYLSNIDAKKAVNLLRTMLQLRKIYVHEELNALVIRDTPDVIELAGQILEAADRADAEVLFDLELLAVRHGDELDLGPRLSTYSVSAGFGQRPEASNLVSDGLEAGGSTDNLVRSFSSLESFYTLPTATFEFAKSLTDSEVLAAPKIRVKNKDKAKVHIGTREPVITVTINGDNRSDNVQYVDVGVKLDVEPTIQLDNTVVTKLNVEVSSVVDRQTTSSGTQVLTINTTNAQTALTLKDGEQTILAGLIRDDSSLSRNTIPFLGDLPLLGTLLTSHNRSKQKTEILLSITPHILQNVALPRPDVASIWSGGEEDLKAGLTLGSFAADYLPDAERTPLPASPGKQSAPAPVPGPALTEPEPVAGAPAQAGMPQEPPRSAVPEVQPEEEPFVPREPEPARRPPAAAPEPTAAPPAPAAPQERPRETVPLVELPPFEIPGEGRSRVTLSGPKLVESGEEFTLAVGVAEVENLYSAPLFVTFDETHLEFVRAKENGFLKQGGQPTIFTTSATAGSGQLMVGYKQGAGGKGASGSGPLFYLTFRAREPGRAPVGIGRINFRDVEGSRIPVEPGGMTVEVR